MSRQNEIFDEGGVLENAGILSTLQQTYLIPATKLGKWHSFWLNIADRWAIDHFRQQQNQFNELAVNQLTSFQHRLQILRQDQQALARTLDALDKHIKSPQKPK
jgi:hypothetical protein